MENTIILNEENISKTICALDAFLNNEKIVYNTTRQVKAEIRTVLSTGIFLYRNYPCIMILFEEGGYLTIHYNMKIKIKGYALIISNDKITTTLIKENK